MVSEGGYSNNSREPRECVIVWWLSANGIVSPMGVNLEKKGNSKRFYWKA